jgi:hypothetical protein
VGNPYYFPSLLASIKSISVGCEHLSTNTFIAPKLKRSSLDENGFCYSLRWALTPISNLNMCFTCSCSVGRRFNRNSPQIGILELYDSEVVSLNGWPFAVRTPATIHNLSHSRFFSLFCLLATPIWLQIWR